VQTLLVPSHEDAQAPAWQAWPDAQAFPHVPQFAGSVCVSLQAVPQIVCPVGQPHAPAVQVWPAWQAFPQAPQFATSVWVNAHTGPHVLPPTELQLWQVPAPPSPAPRQVSVPVQSLWRLQGAGAVWYRKQPPSQRVPASARVAALEIVIVMSVHQATTALAPRKTTAAPTSASERMSSVFAVESIDARPEAVSFAFT
jgi:hypothetical protein